MEETQFLPNLLLFFSMFIVLYLLGYFLIFRNWNPSIRPDASSCLISLFHGTPSVFLAAQAIFADPCRGLSAPNTNPQNVVLDFSSAYFLADFIHLTAFYSSQADALFIAHHAAVLFVFLTCRYLIAHGACALLALLMLAEATSACQNTWTLAGVRRHDIPFAAALYGLLSPPFYVFYTICRGMLAPLVVYKMASFYASGGAGDVIPKWAWLSWIVVIVTAISVSLLWIWNLWVQLYRETRVKLLTKLG